MAPRGGSFSKLSIIRCYRARDPEAAIKKPAEEEEEEDEKEEAEQEEEGGEGGGGADGKRNAHESSWD